MLRPYVRLPGESVCKLLLQGLLDAVSATRWRDSHDPCCDAVGIAGAEVDKLAETKGLDCKCFTTGRHAHLP